jgi:hypothetical protein
VKKIENSDQRISAFSARKFSGLNTNGANTERKTDRYTQYLKSKIAGLTNKTNRLADGPNNKNLRLTSIDVSRNIEEDLLGASKMRFNGSSRKETESNPKKNYRN